MSEAFRGGCQPGLHGGRPGAVGGIQPSGYQPPSVRGRSPVSISVEHLRVLASSAGGHGLPALLLERFPGSPG